MEISPSLVRELPQYLVELPRFAYECSLAGIFNHHQWTPKQSNTFIQLAKPDTTWDMTVSSVESGVLQVDLNDTADHRCLCLNTLLNVSESNTTTESVSVEWLETGENKSKEV